MKLELLVAEKNADTQTDTQDSCFISGGALVGAFEGASGVGHLVGEGGLMRASRGRSLVGGFIRGGYKWPHMAPKNGFGL